MSVFNEFLPRLDEISNTFIKNFKESFQEAFECIVKFEEDILGKEKIHSKDTLKGKSVLNNLQKIDEEDTTTTAATTVTSGIPDDKNEIPTSGEKLIHTSNVKATDVTNENDSNDIKPKKPSKKRSKNEVEDMSSPAVDKRLKRTASVVAQSNISKQVNVNLSQKLRREDSEKKEEKSQTKSRRLRDEDKENEEPIPPVQIKEEKISLPPEPMDLESLPINVEVKEEKTDEIAMPPPIAPVPKPRRGLQKVNSEESIEQDTGRRRTTRTRKQTESISASPPTASLRATRASSRANRQTEIEEVPIKETRPKRTRTKKVKLETSIDTDKDSLSTQDSGLGSPADKPRPKRTRKAQKAVENNNQKDKTPSKQTDPSATEDKIQHSPILQMKTKRKPIENDKTDKLINDSNKTNPNINHNHITKVVVEQIDELKKPLEPEKYDLTEETDTKDINVPDKHLAELDGKSCNMAKVKCTPALDATVTLNNALDQTVVIPNGVYNHTQVPSQNVCNMNNETVVIEKFNRETLVLDQPKTAIAMDATMVLDKQPESNFTDDNSLLTDDNDTPVKTPPKAVLKTQPSSAVKEKVQQFEELASRVTRTKTRELAKKTDTPDNHTPPDKVSKVILSAETLNKMNNMIFNGKVQQQTSSSAVKTSSQIPTMKQSHSSSTSKLSSISRAREAAEEFQKREKEDARKKKEAILEAKRETQRKKREEKMAAAAAARELAEKERHAAMEAAIKERMEKQANADLGKLERLKEVERKKQELARKVAETEERRKAEEQARAQRLADEQKKAEATRKKQLEEAEAMKKEAAIMAKEIEKRKREYYEKQKMKMKINGTTPLKTIGQPCHQDPVYMMDGFQYLNSDSSEEEEVQRPLPRWDNYKHRRLQLYVQEGVQELDTLFLVGPLSPDLRAIFPEIEREYLKRTSSAIWRTPPADARYQK